jgi:MFS family permease
LLTAISRQQGYELGTVMGAQESLSSFARILGPLTGGFVWTKTVGRTDFIDYHTAFHLCGIMMLCAFILSLRISFKPSWKQSEE